MRKTLLALGLCMMALVAYGGLFYFCAEPRFNTLLRSDYDAFDYPKYPHYGAPSKLRDFSYQSFGFDFEMIPDIFFRPAFEIDRRFMRRRLWGGFDWRDVEVRKT